MSEQKQETPRGLLTAEALAEIENSSTSHLPDLGDVIAQYMDEKERLLAHVAAMQAELERGALCEECDRWEYNEDGSCRTYTVCGACWNKQSARLREVEHDLEVARKGIVSRKHANMLVADFRQRAVAAVPTSWLDSLLSGPDGVLGKQPWGCPEIERLLQAVKKRIQQLPATTTEGGE